jgi:eukaryotic-like serine/threonine-protein kinase
VHCDIKPQNLFATRSGGEYDFLKLLDFGIARFAAGGDHADVTQSALVRGTPGYLAPELWQGAEADARSDLYSLGATLYYLLTGSPPFAPTADRGLVRAHLQQIPIAPSARLGQPLPGELDDLVLRCLAKAPEDRFSSAHDLRDALGRVPLASRWTPHEARGCWRDAGEAGIEPFQPAAVT